jgi:hypothetical protein
MPSALWTQRRETSLNWLALGLLLAAWNAVDDPGAGEATPPIDAPRAADAPRVGDATRGVDAPGSAVAPGSSARRPAPLRCYPCVTVRSITRRVAANR